MIFNKQDSFQNRLCLQRILIANRYAYILQYLLNLTQPRKRDFSKSKRDNMPKSGYSIENN